MNNSKCVKSIKVLKYYERYKSAVIASVLVLSGNMFLGGTAESMPLRNPSRGVANTSSNQTSRSNGTTGSTSPSTMRRFFSRTAVLGNQDILDINKAPKCVLDEIDRMEVQSRGVSRHETENGVLYRNVPKWSWSKDSLESWEKSGGGFYVDNGDGTYSIFFENQ